jgi:hypothetical protein
MKKLAALELVVTSQHECLSLAAVVCASNRVLENQIADLRAQLCAHGGTGDPSSSTPFYAPHRSQQCCGYSQGQYWGGDSRGNTAAQCTFWRERATG